MLTFGPTWNPIGILQILMSALWLKELLFILMGKKIINVNSLYLATAFSPVPCCLLAWALGYWNLTDVNFISFYLLTLPAPFLTFFSFMAVHYFQPELKIGLTYTLNRPDKILIKVLLSSLAWYVAGTFLLWVGFWSGFLSHPHLCGGPLCQISELMFGSNDKIFGYLTGFALFVQLALAFAGIALFALIFKSSKSVRLR